MKDNKVIRMLSAMILGVLALTHFTGQMNLLASPGCGAPPLFISRPSRPPTTDFAGPLRYWVEAKILRCVPLVNHIQEIEIMQIKVLGTGCANWKTTLKLIEQVAVEQGISLQIEKVEDSQAIMGYGVMSTPDVVIDGTVVHAGSVPCPPMQIRGANGGGNI